MTKNVCTERVSPKRVSFLVEWERDPAAYVKKQFAALWAQNEREVSEAAKSAEERKYREAYNARHTPETPDAA